MNQTKPIIGRDLFQKSYLSLASGISVEPLLRMSHICQDFIFTCLYLEKDFVKKNFDQQIRWSPDLEIVSYEEVGDFDELRHFELPFNYQKYLQKPSYMRMDEFLGYQQSFSDAQNLPQYCLIYRVLRRSTQQVLTLYYVVSESFATLNLLSQGGRYMPRVIEAIQAGEQLTDPSERGLLTRFLNNAPFLPWLFIRGFQPSYGLFSGFRSNAFEPIGPMNQIAMDFSHWFKTANCNPGYWHDPRRYVKAFASPEFVKLILANQKSICGHASLKLTSVIDELPLIPQTDVLVMGEHFASNPAFKGRNVVTWESMHVNKYTRNYYNTDKLIDKLKAQLKYKKFANDVALHIIPCVNEDQGKPFLASLARIENPSTTYIYRPFDMIDCRLEDFENVFSKNHIHIQSAIY